LKRTITDTGEFRKTIHKYIFDSFVCNYLGIGRFVLGLMDEITITSPTDFKEYLNKRIKNKIF